MDETTPQRLALGTSVNPDDLDEIDTLFLEGELEVRRGPAKPRRRLKVIALISPKGGTGKTSIAMNLAGTLLSRQRKAAVMDLDPRANARHWADAGSGLPFPVHQFDFGEGAAAFRRALRKLTAHVDVLVIDTPPGMGPASRLAMQVADLVVVPAGASALDLDAAREAIDAAHAARHGRQSDLPRIVIVPSRQLATTRLARDFAETVQQFDVPVGPSIGQRVEVAAAATAGRLVRAASPAGKEFQRLARHVWACLRRVPG